MVVSPWNHCSDFTLYYCVLLKQRGEIVHISVYSFLWLSYTFMLNVETLASEKS